ncbi:MAG: deoxynucleotide monophosphate kinase [Pseudomonadota bacterium]
MSLSEWSDGRRCGRPTLVGLCGLAGSGKSTVAEMLVREGFERRKFAGPLKDALRSILFSAGASSETIERMIEGDLKETPTELLAGQTPRHAMQTLGTEWGRSCMSPGFWVDLALAGVEAARAAGVSHVVIDDVRFANEARAIRAAGGVTVRITGRGGISGGHVSELLYFEPDLTLCNRGSIADLKGAVADLLL